LKQSNSKKNLKKKIDLKNPANKVSRDKSNFTNSMFTS